MPTFDGLEDAGREIGYQETKIRQFVDRYRESHEKLDDYADLLLGSLISISQNIDQQNKRGREISRNMASMLDLVRQLHEWDANAAQQSTELPEETRKLLEAMRL